MPGCSYHVTLKKRVPVEKHEGRTATTKLVHHAQSVTENEDDAFYAARVAVTKGFVVIIEKREEA